MCSRCQARFALSGAQYPTQCLSYVVTVGPESVASLQAFVHSPALENVQLFDHRGEVGRMRSAHIVELARVLRLLLSVDTDCLQQRDPRFTTRAFTDGDQ